MQSVSQRNQKKLAWEDFQYSAAGYTVIWYPVAALFRKGFWKMVHLMLIRKKSDRGPDAGRLSMDVYKVQSKSKCFGLS